MFRLLRYFAFTSAAVLLAAAVLLVTLYRQTAWDEVLNSAEQGNTVLAQSLANAIWLHHAERIEMSRNDIDRLGERSENHYLDEAIARLSLGLPVLKVKIFNADGVVVYSTDPKEIGEELDHNPERFAAARQGKTSSEILRRNDSHPSFNEFPGRDVVETYLPLHEPGGEMRGVFELYADVTERFSDIKQMSAGLLGGLLAGFALLYGGLLLVVRRAEQILRSQYVSLRESRKSLIVKNRALTAEIGRRTEIEAELREARDGAEAASRAKSQFLANMSHELRTPLNAVIGFSEVMVNELLGQVSPPRYREYAQDIRDSGRHLLALVNNVLDLAKVESGHMDVDLAPFDVADLVRETVRGVEPDIARNCNSLRVHFSKDLGTMVSDEIRVRGVLTNLIDNAAKFTRNGRIEVEVWWETDGGDGTESVLFRVSDTGIGMDERRIEAMFEEFTQHDSSITRSFGGTGLGLSICRRSCEALGGSIAIESAVGEGTTVTVRLPDGRRFQEAAYRNGAARRSARRSPDPARGRAAAE